MTEQELLLELIEDLGGERNERSSLNELESIWRGLINQTQAEDMTEDYLLKEDHYLNRRNYPLEVDLSECERTAYPNILVYKGDMTYLKVDALVNAANSDMLGCFIPNHGCLDNAIHTFTGGRLRQACHDLMSKQGHKEPVGQVKVTSAYHLPAKLIYHTVGPFIPKGKPASPIRQGLLKQAYLSCLKQALTDGVSSLALPCLSTGEFGFPKDLASQIAVETVTTFLAEHETDLTVVFCLYTVEDQALYAPLLAESTINQEKQEKGEQMSVWTAYEQEGLTESQRLTGLITEADAVVVGIGAGMSAADGFTYIGPRFEDAFPDFIEKHQLLDMLQASLYDFEDWEEYWAFQSRFVALNYLDQPVGASYVNLLDMLKNKDYHIITTNADNAFAVANYDMEKVFHIQGEYGLWQCSEHCHQQTYKDDALIRQMIEAQKDMKIPSDMVPHCPKCQAPFEINKRNEEKGMVEDADFHAQEKRYYDFLAEHETGKVLYLEIGVGHTTPQFIKHPFQERVKANPQALFVTMNRKHYRIPPAIRQQTLQLSEHIAALIAQAKTQLS